MQNFNSYLDKIGEIGVVDKVNHPIVHAEGLPLAKPTEIVIFETGQIGEIFSVEKDSVEVLVFSHDPVKVGIKLVRTDKTLSVPVGKEFLGNVIDPLGQSIYSQGKFKQPTEEREIDLEPLGISKRKKIKRPLRTGVTLVDMMIPIGKGQRELVIGDRKTGKSSFLLTTIKSQVEEGAIAIYAAIARKKSDIIKLEEFFKKEGILDKVIIVASSSYDSPSLIYLTPYTAMTIAEYFRDQGQDVLLVLDDLSTHAKFYREISLLARRFPGRDSYPGDIFFTHARLLERAGNFEHPEKGEAAITCFPIVETVEGDFTGYIATNLMGMTDGHIFFDSNIYYKGRRPAVNIALSVTRVGRQTQTRVKRDMNRELAAFLALNDKMQNLSHFGAELTDTVKDILKTGEKIYNFFDQPYKLIVPEEVQLILFALIWLKFLDEKEEEDLHDLKVRFIEAYKDEKTKEFFLSLFKTEDSFNFNDFLFNVSENKDKILTYVRQTKN